MKIGPSVDLRPVQDLMDMFLFSPSGVEEFLSILQVPVLEYPCGKMFMRFALEQALFRLHLKDTGLGQNLNSYRDYSSYIPYTDQELGQMMALSALMYGNTEDKEWRERLKIMGHQLLRGAFHEGNKWKKGGRDCPRKPGMRNTKVGNVAKTVQEIQHGNQ